MGRTQNVLTFSLVSLGFKGLIKQLSVLECNSVRKDSVLPHLLERSQLNPGVLVVNVFRGTGPMFQVPR